MSIKHWNIGDRVTRMKFMDDGTWRYLGDSCLKRSPLRAGRVISRSTARDDEVFVLFDDTGEIRSYLDHGLDAEMK